MISDHAIDQLASTPIGRGMLERLCWWLGINAVGKECADKLKEFFKNERQNENGTY